MIGWYTQFFNADYLRSYRHMDEAGAAHAAQIATLLRLPIGARILDAAGGYGRIAIPLAGHGYGVTVLDLSSEFVRLGRERAAALGATVEWVQGDMRELPQIGFDAVISIFSSFGYFQEDEENERVVRAAAGALRPGGVFLLDTVNREFAVRHDPFSARVETPDAVIQDTLTFDPGSGRWHTRRMFQDLVSGEQREYAFDLRLYEPSEFECLLLASGFIEVAFYGDLDGTPLTPDSRRMVALARKRAA